MITVLPAMPPALLAGSVPCPCGHADERHDPVALRFCRATVAGDLTRGCLCRPKAEDKRSLLPPAARGVPPLV